MKELYLEVYSEVSDDGICQVPLESLIHLFLFEYLEQPPVLLTLVLVPESKKSILFNVQISGLFEFTEIDNCTKLAKSCRLPVLITNDGTTCVAGLCATLRHIIKSVDPLHKLLGFKQSCLYACAESSIWTKFCEIDITNTVKNVIHITQSQDVYIPTDVVRFEQHLMQPVRIHNIQKQKQDLARLKGHKKISLPDSRLGLIQDLDHIFAEGPEMTVADLILLPCLHIILETIGSVYLKQHLPHIFSWYENFKQVPNIQKCLNIILNINRKFLNEVYVNYIIPKVLQSSLYKSDPKRYKPQNRIFTKQQDVEASLQIIDDMNLNVEWSDRAFGCDLEFDWGAVPFDAQPEGGQLPQKRLQRKSQQLENMARAVLKIAKHNDIIVDFCSGSGHLGLILAHFLPRCQIILLENKEESLGRARERASRLKLTNIMYCQSNLDYFCGAFNIGVSLHACGVATDLVIQRCIQQKASFICCPCCYGSIQPNHMIDYPISQRFKQSALSCKDYLVLGHAADQTHDENNTKTSQGFKCMNIIDTDRYFSAKEAGYTVHLSKLEPQSCTPKNNLLVGLSH